LAGIFCGLKHLLVLFLEKGSAGVMNPDTSGVEVASRIAREGVWRTTL